MFAPFFDMISQIITVSPNLRRDFTAKLSYMHLKKKDTLLSYGQVCNHMYFVVKGLLRSYYEKDHEDVTNWILMENDLAMSLLSFFRRQPSFETIEALEDCEIIYFHQDDLEQMYISHPELERAGRLLTTEYYCQSEERMIAVRRNSAAEKYNDLMLRSPQIISRVPKKYIASYLGVTVETLSRIKARHK